MPKAIRILHVKDGADPGGSLRTAFAELAPHFHFVESSTVSEALQFLAQNPKFDLVLIDHRTPDLNLADFMAGVGADMSHPPVILLTDIGDVEKAIPALDLGIADYLIKHEGYLPQLRRRIEHFVGHKMLLANLEAGKKAEENLGIHQIKLEMQNEELRRSQECLEEERARYFDFYNLAPVGYCTVSGIGQILDANLTLCSLLKTDREKLLLQGLGHFIHPDQKGPFYSLLKRLHTAGKSQGLDLRLHGSGESWVWMHMEMTPFRNEEGTEVLRAVFSDISALKNSESALLQSEAFSRSIINSVDAEIAVLDNNGIIRLVNEAWTARSLNSPPKPGIPASHSWVGRDYLEACGSGEEEIGDESAQRAHAGIKAVLEGKMASFNLEYPCHSPERKRWVKVAVTPLNRDGRGAVISRTDITDQREAEENLRESQKMLAIGTLAGGIAHDFNNILSIILGNAQIAKTALVKGSTLDDYLNEIIMAGTRASHLVQQILSFSRRQPTERKPVALKPVLLEAVRLLRATLPGRISLETDCDSDLPLVAADATQIQQAILNLATNSMQALKGGAGLIRIRLDSLALGQGLAYTHPALMALYRKHPGSTVRISVSDNGPGMEAATAARIFEPFFTTKPVNEGTGLGLSVVHGIVQSHQGAIVVDNRPGEGVTISLYFPALPGQEHANAEAKTTDLAAKGAASALPSEENQALENAGHILYIDDEPSMVAVLKQLLESRGLRFTGFTDPDEALQALRVDPGAFDLLATDHNMPGKTGLEVAREARQIRPDLPVALISGFIDDAMIASGTEAGVREFISKVTAGRDICALMEKIRRSLHENPLPA